MTYTTAWSDHLLLNMTTNSATGLHHAPLIDRAHGAHVFDSDGKRWIDGMSGMYCAQLGYHFAEELAEAGARQASQLGYAPLWSSANTAAVVLADQLVELMPAELRQVFFTSGGAESVESAWKIARQYHVLNGQPERTKALARHGAYHGLTLGALAFTGDPTLKEIFGPPAIPVRHVSDTNSFRVWDSDEASFTEHLLDEVRRAILFEGPDTVAMMIAEPVQNRGGCITPPEGYWSGLRRICDEFGILLVADEVVTGVGRLGEWLGSARYGCVPDLITLAKGLAAGYQPVGAVVVHERVGEPFRRPGVVLNHGYTFGGHPVSCAVASKSLEIMQRENILDNVRDLEPYLEERLRTLADDPLVGHVRGAGFFWCLELVPGSTDREFTVAERETIVAGVIPEQLRMHGLIARVYDRDRPLIQIAPPLTSDRAILGEIVAIIATALRRARPLLEGSIA